MIKRHQCSNYFPPTHGLSSPESPVLKFLIFLQSIWDIIFYTQDESILIKSLYVKLYNSYIDTVVVYW